jgi:hypothetical protein
VPSFKLIPFPADNLPNIQITGEVNRAENQLSIRYEIRGDIDSILLPAPSSPTRKDDLWKATCFEFFIAIPQLPQYWEFNMSPSSEWNVYHMDAYRRIGFREETGIRQLPFEFKRADERLMLDIAVDLTTILLSQQNIRLGIAAIIQTRDGSETYWALAHPGAPTAQADFHLRESFVIET